MSVTDPAPFLWVDLLRRVVPKWLSERILAGFVVAFRFLYVMVSRLDAGTEILLQLTNARYPGIGTPTALALIGASRGLIRGIGETNAQYAAYLNQWRALQADKGGMRSLAKAIAHYCGNVKVVVVNRGGTVVTVAATTGAVTTQHAGDYAVPWNWDGVSNPEKAGHWSELWVLVFSPPWAKRGAWGDVGLKWGADALGFGHLSNHVDHDAIRLLVAEWKRASSRVNCVVFVYAAALFDFTTPAYMPDGTFGKWSRPSASNPKERVGSRFTDCRYWHPQESFPNVHGDPVP